MKTQNTLENKARFFAHYWGNKVFRYFDNLNIDKTLILNHENFGKLHNGYLILTPLSIITDEEANKLVKILHLKRYVDINTVEFFDSAEGLFWTIFYSDFKFIKNSQTSIVPSFAVDQLRSKSYALPWLDLSIDDLIEYGWIKLK